MIQLDKTNISDHYRICLYDDTKLENICLVASVVSLEPLQYGEYELLGDIYDVKQIHRETLSTYIIIGELKGFNYKEFNEL